MSCASPIRPHTHLILKLTRILFSTRQDDAGRKTALLEFAVQTQHRLARLLVASRWARRFGPNMAHATQLEARQNARAQLLDDTADNLWSTHERAQDTPIPPAELTAAVDALTTGAYGRFPRLPEVSIGVDLRPMEAVPGFDAGEGATIPHPTAAVHDDDAVRDAASRLGLATRSAVRDCVAAIEGIHVVEWRAGASDICVRVSAPGLWAANVSLDGLDAKTALFRCHQVSVFVDSDPDALGVPDQPCMHSGEEDASGLRSSLSPAQEATIRGLADDRMSEAAAAASAAASMDSIVDRMQVMLCAFGEMLATEVCAPLVMVHLRTQAGALKTSSWGEAVEVEGDQAEPCQKTPITIRYWKDSAKAASVAITPCRSAAGGMEEARKSMMAIDAGAGMTKQMTEVCPIPLLKRKLITISHYPPLPGYAGKDYFSFIEDQSHALNLEALLEACVRVRSAERLMHVAEAVLLQRERLKVHTKCLTLRSTCMGNEERVKLMGTQMNFRPESDEALVIHLHPDRCTGMEIRVAPRTGALRVRPFGSASLSVPTAQRNQENRSWCGERHIATKAEEEFVVTQVLFNVRSNCKLDAAARAVCALDIGVSNTLPPGTASVAATASADRAASQLVPPFAPLERRSPRRFLTLSPPPPPKDPPNGILRSFVTAVGNIRGCQTRDGAISKRPRLTYATTSDALVFIQESSFANDDRCSLDKPAKRRRTGKAVYRPGPGDMDDVDRYSGTAAAAAAWAVTRDVVERRLRRDSLLRAFVAANVASAAHTHHLKTGDEGALHLESASRVLLKVKSEPLPVRRAELLLRGSDAWQVRLSLLPPIFDSTDPALAMGGTRGAAVESGVRDTGDQGNLWTVGVACGGSQLTFTYPSANAASVRSFFRDLTRARTAAALARSVPPSPYYRVLRRSPVRIVVGIGPFRAAPGAAEANGAGHAHQVPSYSATVEYVYSKGNSGGFSLTFSPTKPTMNMLAPFIEEALDASGGQVGGILAGLLERACPVAAAAESAVRERGNGRIRFVTALRVRAVFAGVEQSGADASRRAQVAHAVDVDARGGGGVVTVIDVGRATAVMIQQGFANKGGHSASASGATRKSDFVLVPKWDEIVGRFCQQGFAEAQRAGSTVVLQMGKLEGFLTALVSSVKPGS